MSAIKLTNGVLLDSESIKMGIDISNLIASDPSLPYTTTEDCYCIPVGSYEYSNLILEFSGYPNFAPNGTPMYTAYTYSGYRSATMIFLRKGTRISWSSTGVDAHIYFFGTK